MIIAGAGGHALEVFDIINEDGKLCPLTSLDVGDIVKMRSDLIDGINIIKKIYIRNKYNLLESSDSENIDYIK